MRLSLLTWLCTSLSAGLPRWSFIALLPLSCFRHVWHRFLGCQSLELFTLSLSLSSSPARDLQQKTWQLRFCLLEVKIHCTWRLSCCLLQVGHRYVLDLAASHRLGHLCFSWHVWSRCSFLRNFDLFLKLFVITSTRSFQDVRISSGTILVQNSRGKFCLFSH